MNIRVLIGSMMLLTIGTVVFAEPQKVSNLPLKAGGYIIERMSGWEIREKMKDFKGKGVKPKNGAKFLVVLVDFKFLKIGANISSDEMFLVDDAGSRFQLIGMCHNWRDGEVYIGGKYPGDGNVEWRSKEEKDVGKTLSGRFVFYLPDMNLEYPFRVIIEGKAGGASAVEPPSKSVKVPKKKSKNDESNGAPEDMVLIPAGEFWMGSTDNIGKKNEHPRHKVWVDAFYIDTMEVTFDQYDRFCKSTGRNKVKDWDYGRGQKPANHLDWYEAREYCAWAGKRLPTEAEWEKAARGGTDTIWFFGDDENDLVQYARYNTIGRVRGADFVARRKPNQFGLYDVYGNVKEWVEDWYGEYHYSVSEYKNPKGPSSGEKHVARGGSWNDESDDARSANRSDMKKPGMFNVVGVIGCRCAKDAE